MSTSFDGSQDGEATRMRLNSVPADPGGGGTSAGTTKVDTQRLDGAANALVELRGDTENVDNKADEDTLGAVTGLNRHTAPGPPEGGSWATAGSLVGMDVRWGDQVANLKLMLQDISDKLHTSSGHYTRAEQEEQARQASIHTPFG
ncbi:hypothetical protein PV703_19465 [Streptomyces sp. ME01-24h]|nr:hypothetical protein [Streptomyces sp. ME19-03-3]MDX3355444.1 hypothetical protein [Streptomyces sp. ME01-24h]